jgi:hypothetical protein
MIYKGRYTISDVGLSTDWTSDLNRVTEACLVQLNLLYFPGSEVPPPLDNS